MRTRPERPSRGRRSLPVALAVAIAAAMLPLAALPGSAAVKGGQSIEVFTGTNLVSLTGYPANKRVEVTVLRKGFEIGHAVKKTDNSGAIEMNHVGGADCFEGRRSPDIQPGDAIRTHVLGTKNVDRSVVRGVFIDDFQVNASSITVSGHVRLAGPAKVVPGTDVLELRINIDQPWDVNDRVGRRDRRVDIGDRVNAAGDWTITLDASADDIAAVQAGNEHFLEWSPAVAGERFPPELTVWDVPEAEALDCPPILDEPTAPLLAKADDSGARDHVTTVRRGLDFAGLTFADTANAPATLLVDGVEKAGPVASQNGKYHFSINLAPRATPYKLVVSSGDVRGLVRSVTIQRR